MYEVKTTTVENSHSDACLARSSFVVPATSYKIEVVAGNGTKGYSGDGYPAVYAQLNWPTRLTFHQGDLYIPEAWNHVIRKVDLHSKKIPTISTVAGQGGKSGFQDGPGINALFNTPSSCIFDRDTETMYVGDFGNYLLRQISANQVSTIAGNREDPKFLQSSGLKTDGNGNIYVAERDNHRIRKISQQIDGTWKVEPTIAGTGTPGFSGDNGPPTRAQLNGPVDLVFDSMGNLYIADKDNNRIRKITSDLTTISTFVDADNIHSPRSIAVDKNDNLYIADTLNNRFIKVDKQGNVVTIAGNGQIAEATPSAPCSAPVVSDAQSASLGIPHGIVVDTKTNAVYVTDTLCEMVYKLTPSEDPPSSNQAPVIDSATANVNGDGSVTLDATGVYDPDGNIPLTCQWIENGFMELISCNAIKLSLSGTGMHTITLRVADNNGKSSSKEFTITVPTTTPTNQPPIADFTPDPAQGVAPLDVQVRNLSASDLDGGNITKYDWTTDDGQTATGPTPPKFTFVTPGTHSITLTVTDDDNETKTVTKPVQVDPPPLVEVKLVSEESVPINASTCVTSGFDVTIKLEAPATQKIGSAQTTLTFDPKLLKVTEVKSSNQLQNIFNGTDAYDNKKGEVYFMSQALTGQEPQGTFPLFTVSFQPQKTGATQLQFVKDDTFVYTPEQSASILKSADLIAINIQKTAVFKGKVKLYPATTFNQIKGLRIRLSPDPSSGTVPKVYEIDTDSGGNFSLLLPPLSNYDIYVSRLNTLQTTKTVSVPNTCGNQNPVDFGTLYPGDFVGSPGIDGIVADPPNNSINVTDLDALKFYSEGKPYKVDYNLSGDPLGDANDMDISFLNSFFDLNGDGKVDFEDNKGDKQTLKDIIKLKPKGDNYPGLTKPYVRKGLRESSERLILHTDSLRQFDTTIHLQLDETQEVDGVETHFTFDPNILQVNRITLKNQFDDVILNDFDNTQGSIDFLGIQTGKTNLKGGFDLMTVNFTWLDQTLEPVLLFEPDQIITVFKGRNVPHMVSVNFNQELDIPHMVSVNFNQTVSLLTGKIKLQVPPDPYRKTDLLIHLDADPKMYHAQTDSEGIFTVELPSGTHDVYVTRPNTLQNKVKVTIGENTEVIDFGTLYGGDVIGSGPPNMRSANNRIDVYDFWALQAFEKEFPVPPLDYNLDGIFEEKTDLDPMFLYTLFDIDNDGIVVGEKEYVAMVNSLTATSGTDSLPPLEAKRPHSAAPQMQQLPLEVSHLLAGQTFDILVKMQPVEDMMKVEGAEIHLNFDPSLLQVESITDGKNFDKVPLNHFDNSTGNIDFLTVAFNNIIPQGTFDLMTIHFKLLAQGGNPTLTFDQNQLKAVFRGRAVDVNLLVELNEAEPPPLVVTSSSFIATPEENGILLSWETDLISQSAGFNLFRSEKNTNQPVQLNVGLIPTQSESAVYTFLDNTILPGIVYDYTLEELEMDGQSSQYGPISFLLIRSPEDNRFFTSETVPTFEWSGEPEEVFTLQYTYENEPAVHEISTRGTILKPTVEEWQAFAKQAKGRVISWHVRDAQGNFSETRRFTVTE
ncbi:hypothetical protein THII_2544 [Thioploca ingrica]|uniref:PKD domain-containing protein n=1 Tax=Thioploca ingrica TaxID=40754 RepID=A0A090BVH0_9GAMM|nr:hypothetical protein THII_2544 [Thioploca ingrica]